jgi:site-specific DNA-methyltransferase (adenine-specific)
VGVVSVSWRIIEGDCTAALADLSDGSVDAIVTDPPYGLGFMGREWDALPPGLPWARECLRVLKPGGHLLAFGGTRTYHRLTCAVEDAGFEIRDCLAWLYGSGFPKSLDVSKAIDKAAGAEREVVGTRVKAGMGSETTFAQDAWTQANRGPVELDITAPATPDAARWEGWGTALKPAHEPIVLARKPLAGTVAGNVLAHGTGALNVNGCRIGSDSTRRPLGKPLNGGAYGTDRADRDTLDVVGGSDSGRWPANVLLDGEAAAMLDQPTANLKEGFSVNRNRDGSAHSGNTVLGARNADTKDVGYGDSGGASRFFLTVQPDKVCALCSLPCVVSAGPNTTPSDPPNGTAPEPVQAGQQRQHEDSSPPSSASAKPAGSDSSTTSRTERAGSVLPPAMTERADWIVQLAKSAVSLCGSCETATAQNVALWLHDPVQASRHGAASTSAPSVQTLSRSLALVAEGSRSTGIIPTTESLSALCGSAVAATTASTTANATASGGAPNYRLKYQSKASSAERNAGLDGFEAVDGGTYANGAGMPGRTLRDGEWVQTDLVQRRPRANVHPTVKPIDLMRWLCRLVTPPGGTVLDTFTGSGTTGCAAVLEGFDFIGVERELEYAAIARARIEWWSRYEPGVDTDKALAAGKKRDVAEASGLGSLFDGLDDAA